MNTTRKITFSLIAVLTLFFATSCKEDENSDLLPVVTTSLASSNYLAVNVQGVISPKSGLTVLERGVCWSKGKMPTLDSVKIAAGQGVGTFTCSIVGLTPDSTYHARAYATSKAGTTYGLEVTFKAPVMLRFKPKAFYDSIYDVEGNKYYVDTIGTQVWMCENLRVTKYRDGSPIANITSNTDWTTATTGGYCSFNNSSQFLIQKGLLYNWFAATDPKNIAPQGWHVATDADWATLSTFLGSNAVAGGKLKESGFDNWSLYASSIVGSNSSGFTALPGGCRSNYNGSFYYQTTNGFWWTATASSGSNAVYRSLANNNNTLDIQSADKANGYSVRCVKD